MADIVSKKIRSKMMAGIQCKDTKPELKIRSALHKVGYRYKLYDRNLPGKPDLVFPKHNAVVFIHGCFWHLHDCHLFKWPSTRADFWRKKITGNKMRDEKNKLFLKESGWRVLTVWECALKGKYNLPLEEVIETTSGWLLSNEPELEIRGSENR